MGTEAKEKAKRPRGKASRRDAPALPPGCEAFVGKAQICFALGVSVRTFSKMCGADEFPKPDAYIGIFPRWRMETLNRWIRQRSGLKEG
jgi:predicted DNA-binding transcriptional regulator AlpA